MARTGGTYALCRGDQLDRIDAGEIDFGDPDIEPEDAAKKVGELLKPRHKLEELGECRLCVSGPFGLAWFDILVNGAESKLRRTA